MTRKMANLSAAGALLALSALTSVALAEPVKLTDAQMDQVSAGAWVHDGANLFDASGLGWTYTGEENSTGALTATCGGPQTAFTTTSMSTALLGSSLTAL